MIKNNRPLNLQTSKDMINSYLSYRFYNDYNCQLNLAIGAIVPYLGDSKYCNVLDLDETILDKSALGKQLDYGYTTDALVAGWTRTDIPAFDKIKEFMHKSMVGKLDVYIITARTEFYRESTVNQLKANGLIEGTHYVKLIMKPNDSKDNTITFKSAERAKLVASGLVILANIGDHDDDIYNVDGTLSGIFPVLLPNCMY